MKNAQVESVEEFLMQLKKGRGMASSRDARAIEMQLLFASFVTQFLQSNHMYHTYNLLTAEHLNSVVQILRSNGCFQEDVSIREKWEVHWLKALIPLFDIKQHCVRPIDEATVFSKATHHLENEKATKRRKLDDAEHGANDEQSMKKSIGIIKCEVVCFSWIQQFLSQFFSYTPKFQLQILLYIASMLPFLREDTLVKLQMLYALFMQCLKFESLRRPAVQILQFLTEDKHIKRHRISRVQEMIATAKDAGQSSELLEILLAFYEHRLKNQPLPLNVILCKPPPSHWSQILRMHLPMYPKRYSSFLRKRYLTTKVNRLLTLPPLHLNTTHQIQWDHQRQAAYLLGVETFYDQTMYRILDESQQSNLKYLSQWCGYDGDISQPCVPLQFLHPKIEVWVLKKLSTWDGARDEDAMFSLLSHARPKSFEDLYTTIFLPLHRLGMSSSPRFKAKIIGYYRSFVQNLASVYPLCLSLQDQYNFDDEQMLQLIVDILQFTERICVLGLLQHEDHVLLQHEALSYVELIVELLLMHGIPVVIPPSKHLVYRLLMSSVSSTVSRMCGILFRYKQAFEALKNDRLVTPNHTLPRGLDKIGLFNSYLWDFSNVLWKNVLFPQNLANSRVRSELTSGIPRDCLNTLQSITSHASHAVHSSLSLTHSLAFVGLARRFIQKKNVSVTDAIDYTDIKGNMRIDYVEYLRQNGMEGLDDFLFTFMSSLMEWRRKQMISNEH